MTYIVRTDGHVLVAQISNWVAGKIIKEVDGHWKEINSVKRGKKTVYIIDEQSNFGNQAIQLVLWEGFYLEEE